MDLPEPVAPTMASDRPGLDPERDVLQHPPPIARARIARTTRPGTPRRARPARAAASAGTSGSVIAARSRKSWLIRPIDAAPRCTRLTAQPSAIIGQTSIARYTPKATNSPTVTVPAMTSRPPA